MRKLKLVGALMLAILIMASCVSMSVLAEQNESPTDNKEKIEISNTDAPSEAGRKAKKSKKGPSRREKQNPKASEEELDQESSDGDDLIEAPKQESPDTQQPGAEEPTDANAQDGVPPEGDPVVSDPTGSEKPKNGPEQQGKVFEITFVVEGDRTVVKLAEGDAIIKPQNDPVKSGFDFVHWYDADGSEKTEFVFGVGAKKDLELKALFTKIKSDDEGEDDSDDDDSPPDTTIEDEDVPLGSGAVSDPIEFDGTETDRSITIVSDRGNKVRYGDTITLTGKLSGFAGEQYSLTWRHDNGNGAWTDFSHGSTICTFVLDEQNVDWNWQLVAVING